MVSINTNLSSLIVQSNLTKSTNALNQAIERMTTGFKINHASDNAANYSIANSMDSKISSLDVASDNVAMGIDMISTATDSLDLINSHLTRIRDLMEQSANGTYSESSRQAIQAEVDQRLNEINRIVENCEYNGIQIFNSGILPPASKVKLTDFGMSAGSIDFATGEGTRTVNLTNEDTLFSLMKKMETVGVKSDFDENTGIFSVNVNASDVTDNGTGFKEILGLEDTSGYQTDVLEENVEKTRTETALLSTRLDAVGITNGNFTIVGSDGTQTNDSISVTSTIQDLFDKLAEYDIMGTLDENGVISLDTESNYIKGALANQLGIKYTETTNTEYDGITTNTSNSLTKTVTSTATNDTTMAQLGIALGDTLEVRNNNSEVINLITADASILNQSVGTFLNGLVSGGYLTSASMTDGVISLSSDTHNYVTGSIATKFGIGVITDGTGIITTVAKAQTSSSAVTYTVTTAADLDTTFSELSINTDSAVEIFDSNNTKLGEFSMTQNSTLEEFLASINAVTTEGNATLTNGIISISNGYIAGDIADDLGMGYEISYLGAFRATVNQVRNFSGTTYVSNNVTYTVCKTAAQLKSAISTKKNIILANNIDLTNVSWSSYSYDAILDGNGYVISNLSGSPLLNSNSGTVRNLGIINANVTTGADSNGAKGILVSSNSSTIRNCFVYNSKIQNNSRNGGIVGYNNGTITQCTVSHVNIKTGYVGGIAGTCNSSSTISNCNVNSCTISGSYTGGVVGYARLGTVTGVKIYDCNITGSSYGGGLIGYLLCDGAAPTVTNCNINSQVSGSGTIGRFVGQMSASFLQRDITVVDSCTYDASMTSPGNVGYRSTKIKLGSISSGTVTLSSTELAREAAFSGLYIATDSFNFNNPRTYSLTNSTTLSQLGINSSKTFTINGNNVVTIGVNDSIVSKLQNAGLGISISKGKLTITGDSNHILTAMDSALATALKINVGDTYTYDITGEMVHSNTNSTQRNITNVTALTSANASDISMADLGLSSNATITTKNGVINISRTDMMSDVIGKFNNAGLMTSINDSNSTLTIIGNSNNYITSASNNIKNLLGLTTGNGYTYNTNTITTRSDSNSKAQTYQEKYTIQQIATENTQLSKFNSATNFAAGNLVFNTEDGNKVINLTESDTIRSLRKKLSQNGITTDFTGGKLTISGDKGAVSIGEGSTSNFASFAGLNYDSTLDNFAVSDNLTSLADDISEENANKTHEITIMAGINGGSEDMITIDTSLKLGRFSFDVMSSESSRENLDKIDTILNTVMTKQTEYASATNRLESASESILTYMENLTSSLSTLRDADIAKESSNYIKAQILQQASATLLATANQSPSIALQLI